MIFGVVDSQMLPCCCYYGCSPLLVLGVLPYYCLMLSLVSMCSWLFLATLMPFDVARYFSLLLLGVILCCCAPFVALPCCSMSSVVAKYDIFSLVSERCLLTHVKYLFCDFIHHNVGNVCGFIHHYIIIVEITKFISHMLRPIALGKSLFYYFGLLVGALSLVIN